MAMLTKDFWYDLPPERIAQAPVSPRDSSKLMVLSCQKQEIGHLRFHDLPSLLKPGDLLVWNDTKVFRARLTATLQNPESSHGVEASDTNEPLAVTKKIEIFLLHPDGEHWLVLAKPGRKLKIDGQIFFEEGVSARVIKKHEDGTVTLKFSVGHNDVFAYSDRHGEIPVPPYVEKAPQDEADYQTVYADKVGSVAAPTAGFHFTPVLIDKLKAQGINFASVTLHVGLGTFRPIMTETLEEHQMHEEWIDVPQQTCDLINRTKHRGGRVIAVGTTTVRSLESAARKNENQELKPFSGFTRLFIKPGDRFHIVDCMVTNFHLPESTLIVLISAFAQSKMPAPDQGRQFVLKAYEQAAQNEYRFYSFGDAMFIC